MRVLLLGLLLLVPVAAAQHAHPGGGAGAVVLYDGPANGRAVVGGLTHFGFALLDAQGAPRVHQDAQFTVTLDNATLFATNDTHEYDGLFSFDVVFPRAGHYVVRATSGETQVGVFEGDAVPATNVTVPKVVFTSTPDGRNGIVGFLDVVGPDGKTIPHTDAILEWRNGAGLLASRYHAHVHDAPIEIAQAFDVPDEYVLHVTAYKAFATGRSTDVPAVAARFPVAFGALAVPALNAPSAAPAPREPAGPRAASGGLTLHGMYDPQNQVTAGFPVRLSGLALGNDSRPKAHVDFEVTVTGPRGTLFQSKSLHEYDGHFEWLYVPQVPGLYAATFKVTDGTDTIQVPLEFQVVPPVAPVTLADGGSAGPATLAVQGLDKAVAGVPVDLTFSAMGPSGPIAHSEIDVTIARPDAPAAYSFKLHTHGSGLFKATVVFPEAGDWTIRLDALPTDFPPVAFQGPDGLGMPAVIRAKIGAGPALVDASSGLGAEAPRGVPGAGVPLLALGLLAALLLARRR